MSPTPPSRTVLAVLLLLALPGSAILLHQRELHQSRVGRTPPGVGAAAPVPTRQPTPPLGAGASAPPVAVGSGSPPEPRPVRRTGPGPAAPVGQASGRWTLTFEDTFDGEELDPSNWSPGFGWGPYDSNAWVASCAVPQALRLGGGLLTLQTSPDPPDTPECAPGGKTHRSGAINTRGRFSQEYGYFEARVRMPGRRGVLGAWWLHRADGRWPPEIDIAEVLGSRPREHEMALHFDDPSRRGHESAGQRRLTTDLSLGFHVYAVDWQPGQIVFYRDGVEQARMGPEQGALYQRGPSYLILNNMVCTSASRYWCEAPDETTVWGEKTNMQVDWVRVWQRR